MFRSQTVDYLGRIRRCSLVGGRESLGVGFQVWKAYAKPWKYVCACVCTCACVHSCIRAHTHLMVTVLFPKFKMLHIHRETLPQKTKTKQTKDTLYIYISFIKEAIQLWNLLFCNISHNSNKCENNINVLYISYSSSARGRKNWTVLLTVSKQIVFTGLFN